MRWLLTATLAALLLLVQADLWFGRGSLPHQWRLESELAAQEKANIAARERNARTTAEVTDLKEGLEMVEEKARHDLGMIQPDEILVQVAKPR